MKVIIFLNLYAKFIVPRARIHFTSVMVIVWHAWNSYYPIQQRNIYIFSFLFDLDQTGQILPYRTSCACLIRKIIPWKSTFATQRRSAFNHIIRRITSQICCNAELPWIASESSLGQKTAYTALLVFTVNLEPNIDISSSNKVESNLQIYRVNEF